MYKMNRSVNYEQKYNDIKAKHDELEEAYRKLVEETLEEVLKIRE